MINSPIFGQCEEPEIRDKELIESLTNEFPVHVFAAINKKLNSHGYIITIDVLQDDKKA